VSGGARSMALAGQHVPNEDRGVEPRRSYRRSHVPNVGAGATAVVARAPWVLKEVTRVWRDGQTVSDDASLLTSEGQHVSDGAGFVIGRIR
jgi:hypothetical protein